MKIIELRASNFARLRAIEIRPEGSVVPITGANSQGKSSVLRAIWTALKGRTVAPPRPINDNAEEAEIQIDLGTIKVVRRFATDKHSGEITTDLTVLDANGAKMRRTPQAVIDSLLGDLSFDPLAFARAKPEDQYLRLRDLVPDVDFDAIATERRELYDERTTANRTAKNEMTLAEGIKLPVGGIPDAIDVARLMKQLQGAMAHNSNGAAREAALSARRSGLDRMKTELADLRRKVHSLENEIAVVSGDIDEEAANLPVKIDVTQLQEQIASAQRIDGVRKMFAARSDHLQKANDAHMHSTALTESIAEIDEQVRVSIAAAKLPAGLALDVETKTVLLHGKPLTSAGTAERIVASAEVAMALNPELRVMLIDEGSELDRAHMDILATIASDRDYQIWLARVEEGEGGVGFRIEDGSNAGAGAAGITDATLERAKGKGSKR